MHERLSFTAANTRLALVALAATAGLAATPRTASALTPSTPVRVRGNVDVIQASPDGSLQLVTSSNGDRVDRNGLASISTLSTTGQLGASTLLVPMIRAVDQASTAFTASGAIAAYSTGGKTPRIEIVERDATGIVGVPQTISASSKAPSGPLAVAGGGAVAVGFLEQTTAKTTRPLMAFRPPGQTIFGPPLPVDGATAGDVFSPVSTGLDYQIRLGADGAGAVLSGPGFLTEDPAAVRIRRIAADGTLGPWIPVGTRTYNSGQIDFAIGPDGTIVIAMATNIEHRKGNHFAYRSAIESTSLPVGATVVTPVQVLSKGGTSGDEESNLSVSIGLGGQTVVADSGENPGRVDLFTGPAGALTRTATYRAYLPIGVMATVTPDGGVTAVWSPASKASETSTAPPTLATHQPPGGAFSTPRPIIRRAKHVQRSVDPYQLEPMIGGEAALVYYDESYDPFRAFVVRLGP